MKHVLCRVISGYRQAKPHVPYDSAIVSSSVYSRNLEEREEGERGGGRERGGKEREETIRIKQALHAEEPSPASFQPPYKKVPLSAGKKNETQREEDWEAGAEITGNEAGLPDSRSQSPNLYPQTLLCLLNQRLPA